MIKNVIEENVFEATSCYKSLKNHLCKHILGLVIRLGYAEPPPAAKAIPLGQKSKRGRPSKAKIALIKQYKFKPGSNLSLGDILPPLSLGL